MIGNRAMGAKRYSQYEDTLKAVTKLKGVFDLRWWSVKELQDKSVIQAVKVDTAKNVADLFTKCLLGYVFKKLLQCVRERTLSIAQRK